MRWGDHRTAPSGAPPPQRYASGNLQSVACLAVLIARVFGAAPAFADPVYPVMVVDPETSGTLYAGTACSGLAKSIDSGRHWRTW